MQISKFMLHFAYNMGGWVQKEGKICSRNSRPAEGRPRPKKFRLLGGGVSCLKFYGEQTKVTQIIRRRFECLKSYKEQTKVTKTRSSGGISCI